MADCFSQSGISQRHPFFSMLKAVHGEVPSADCWRVFCDFPALLKGVVFF